MDFEIVNDNADTAYLEFGSADPTGTYVVADGITVFNNGTTAAVGETISLSQSTTFAIGSGDTLSGVDIEQFVSGKLLVSLDTPLANLDGTAFQYDAGGDSTTRWDKIEASIYEPGSTMTNAVDLTATDFIGLNFTVEDLRGGADEGTVQTSSESLVQAFTDIADEATDPTSSAEKYVVVTGTAGLWVPALNEYVLRIIAPSTVPSAGLPAYTNLDDYISAVETSISQDGTIDVAGRYEGGGSTATTEDQYYSFNTYFDAQGDLFLVSNASTIISEPGVDTGISAGHTIEITSADLESGVLGANPPYTVDGTSTSLAANDVYAAAVTNILGGFDLGFVESNAANPNSGQAFDATSTGSWYFPQLTSANAYGYAQPDNNTYYDQYAAALAKLGDAYGFPFSDLLSGPQLSPSDSDTVKITINADDTAPPCFATGSRIATEHGAVAVEDLTIGMRVMTLSGEAKPIIWIGSREVDLRTHPQPDAVMPIRVLAHAFGPGRPSRDLSLSPDHAILAEGVLIPVKQLVTDGRIEPVKVDRITYWHVELADHDILLAEGLAVESYLDTGDRAAFSQAGVVTALHPAWGNEARDVTLIREALGYASLTVAGTEVAAVRAKLAQRSLPSHTVMATAHPAGQGVAAA